jgi:uncharacterized protein YndB with AHSA1/START domain
MSNQNFTTNITVDQSPSAVFDAINNPRGWWSEEIEGDTDHLGGEWTYHFQDVHRCTLKIVEFNPGKRVVWQVLANDFDFTKDKSEWVGTTIVFDISLVGGSTHVRFSHEGLVPAYECYDVCKNAWTDYIQNSLFNLITHGKGNPNPREGGADFTTTISVDQAPEKVFEAINNIRDWWTGDIQGDSRQLGDEFSYRHKDIHYSKQKVVEMVPGKRVAWLVTDSQLNFVRDKAEWTGTKIVFDLSRKHGKTHVRFTHEGLKPEGECYDDCSQAWTYYVAESLRKYISA